ncbi:MAG: protein jag [Firmicutes bacterium]|nr:protein jag [Bacillota bacterium]
MDYSEKWGVDVEEAVKLALVDLKVSREDVEITVLEEPSKGFFGIGSKLAKVRVEVKKPEIAPQPEPTPAPKAEVKQEEKPQETKVREKKSFDKKRNHKSKGNNVPKDKMRNNNNLSANLDEIDKSGLTVVEDNDALTFLKEVTEKMGLSLDFTCREGDNVVYVEMKGKDSRTVIGKRGQTLDAIQYLTSLVINKDKDNYVKVVLDAENYRAKRQKTLEQLANRLAAKVVKTRRYVRLEPMNPYERKVIHATLQQNNNVITRSEGEEPYRRVIIELKK